MADNDSRTAVYQILTETTRPLTLQRIIEQTQVRDSVARKIIQGLLSVGWVRRTSRGGPFEITSGGRDAMTTHLTEPSSDDPADELADNGPDQPEQLPSSRPRAAAAASPDGSTRRGTTQTSRTRTSTSRGPGRPARPTTSAPVPPPEEKEIR
jgi:predicted transcriptional regulator